MFVDEAERARALALEPASLEMLTWGPRVVGLRITLANATPARVAALLKQAWTRRAPKRLLGDGGA